MADAFACHGGHGRYDKQILIASESLGESPVCCSANTIRPKKLCTSCNHASSNLSSPKTTRHLKKIRHIPVECHKWIDLALLGLAEELVQRLTQCTQGINLHTFHTNVCSKLEALGNGKTLEIKIVPRICIPPWAGGMDKMLAHCLQTRTC